MSCVLAQAGLFLTYPVLAIAGGLAISIPIVIHLLTKLRRRPRPWAAMRFLIDVQRRHRRRLQLEQLLLLAVRCLIPVTLGLALSGPLLAGCAGRLGGLLHGTDDGSGRFVCIVIDDSMSTQVRIESGQTRFEQLQRLALGVVEGLDPGDHVSVWRAAQPAGVMPEGGNHDLAAARQSIKSIQPRYSRSDLIATLSLVNASLAKVRIPADRLYIILISDFASDALPTDQPLPRQLLALGRRAQLLVARPMPQAANVQVTTTRPMRRTILITEDQPLPTIPVQVGLRRFVDEESRGLTRITLSIMDADLPVAVTRLDHRWNTGRSEAVIHTNLSLTELNPPRGSTPTDSGRPLTIRAQIEPDDDYAGTDTLLADNERYTVLKIRKRISVGLVDEVNAKHLNQAEDAQPTPNRWLRLALTPQGLDRHRLNDAEAASKADVSPIDLKDFDASSLTPQMLRGVDVAMVLRPDMLDKKGWLSLRHLTQRGGLVWLFMPNHDSPALWAEAINTELGLDWQLGNHAVSYQSAASEAGQPLAAGDPAPRLLNMLGADWPALVAPIRVNRSFHLMLRQPPASPETVWLTTSDDTPILVSSLVGDGRVVMWTTALQTQWTNLPTKPLFVPLLHETIRSALSDVATDHRWMTLCGQRPLFDLRWDGANALERLWPDKEAHSRIRLAQTVHGLQATTELNQPGIYAAVPAEVGHVLAVNVDPDGGDTRAVDPQRLAQWLSALGKWGWLEAANPAGAFTQPDRRVALGWPLLWGVLGLVLFEICLARWFSHAAKSDRSWYGRIIAHWRHGDGGASRGRAH